MFLLLGPDTPPQVSWRSIGPGGGGWLATITVVDDEAHTVYVGCDVGGVYKSTDHGLSWQIKNTGLSNYYVQDIAYDPETTSTLYVGTRGGVFKSTNGGDSWVSKRSGFPEESAYDFSAPVSDIVVDPTLNKQNIIYAGIGVPRSGYKLDGFHWQNAGVKGAIYKSTNYGETWTLIQGAGIDTTAMIYSLAIDPGNSDVIYAATSSGVYKSINAGTNWTSININLPLHLRAMTLVIDPSDTEVLYVTMWAEPGSEIWQGGVYKSINGGDSWDVKNNGLPQTMGAEEGLTSNYPLLVIDESNPQILYLGNNSWTPDPGIYKTTDAGENWIWISKADPPDQNVDLGWITQHGVGTKTMAIDPSDSDRLYFGTSMHLLKTENAGVTWSQAFSDHVEAGYWKGRGLETSVVQEIAVDPTNSDNIYVGYWDNGFFKSVDGGVSFKRTTEGMTYDSNTFSIIVDPFEPSILYAATGWWEENKGVVVKSTDSGETWTVIGNGLPDATIWSIALDEASPTNLRTLYAASYDNGIFKTTDGGLNWVPVNNGLGVGGNLQVRKILVDPNNSQILYAGIKAKVIENGDDLSTVQGGLFKSTDAGLNWARIDGSMPQLSVWDIDVAPGDSQTIYTSVSSEYDHTQQIDYVGGVYKSSNSGVSWTMMNTGFGEGDNLNVLSIAINPQNNSTVYAVTSDAHFHDRSSGRGIFKSSDAGSSWVTISDESKVLYFDVITIDPSNPSLLYAGSGGNGVLKGVDLTTGQ